ncbi:MAG TPA: PAS domain-containing sensor histidine kinase, partial [Deinococcales bacterium]|nr:PAS domain-containing sensor histidine kinase [Deinococcales bacterium]
PVTAEDGHPLGAVVTVHDVTLERGNEAALAEQAQLLDLAQDAIISSDLDGNIRHWNPSAERLYGFTRQEALGQNVHRLLATRWPQPFEQVIEQLVRQGVWEGELLHTCRDGREVIVWSRQAVRRDPDGQAVAYLESNRDITSKKEADRALEALNATLEERVRERTGELRAALDALRERTAEQETFLYTVSHDLRAPLLSISGMNSLLEEAIRSGEDEDALRAADRIAFNARKMDALLTDLLTLSRVGRGLELPQAMTLEGATKSALSELEASLRARGLEVVFPARWHAITIEPTGAYQLAANLLTNAVRYAGANGQPPRVRIENSLQRTPGGPRVLYRVHDNGPGVPEAYRDRIFELFRQVNPNPRGTGVGLAIVKRIAERHGGTVSIDTSPVLGGAVFTVNLPAAGD